MSRRGYSFFTQTDFRGGINQEPENARPNQVLDARNVWTPNGSLIQRPGYRGRAGTWDILSYESSFSAEGDGPLCFHEDNTDPDNPVYTQLSSSLTALKGTLDNGGATDQVGDRLYVGITGSFVTNGVEDKVFPHPINAGGTLSDPEYPGYPILGYFWSDSGTNVQTVETPYKVEYYDGTRWRQIDAEHADHSFGTGTNLTSGVADGLAGTHPVFGAAFDVATIFQWFINFVAPKGWGKHTITSADYDKPFSGYFWRLTPMGADLAAAGGIDLRPSNLGVLWARNAWPTENRKSSDLPADRTICQGLFQPQYYSTRRTLRFFRGLDDAATASGKPYAPYMRAYNSSNLKLHAKPEDHSTKFATKDWGKNYYPATMAVIPEFNDAYVGAENRVFRCQAFKDIALATVEDDENVVGEDVFGAPYPRDIIAQEGEFPKANYVIFHKGHLFCAGIEGAPDLVQWSAAAPDYRIFPSESFARLAENDNSPITGMSIWNEQLVIFKQDSIWRLVFAGTDEGTGLNVFATARDVSGVGCVSAASIASIPEGLIFLGEDGFYVYNGVSAKKVSDNVDEAVDAINSGRRPWAVGTHWKSRSCYLCSVTTTGGLNDTVFVYDYKHRSQDEGGQNVGSWWLWDDLNVEGWLRTEGEANNEQLLFWDAYGGIYEFGRDKDDAGSPIDCHVETQRLGYQQVGAKRVGLIELSGTNDVDTLTVTVRKDDGRTVSDYSVNMTESIETAPADFEFKESTDTTAATDAQTMWPKRRTRERISVRETGEHFRVKISSSTYGQEFKLYGLKLGVIPFGLRK